MLFLVTLAGGDIWFHNEYICLQTITKDEFEKNFVSALIPPDEIGVKFDDIGALEDVKRTLNELVSLPMRRPELFSRGNLLRVNPLISKIWTFIILQISFAFVFFIFP